VIDEAVAHTGTNMASRLLLTGFPKRPGTLVKRFDALAPYKPLAASEELLAIGARELAAMTKHESILCRLADSQKWTDFARGFNHAIQKGFRVRCPACRTTSRLNPRRVPLVPRRCDDPAHSIDRAALASRTRCLPSWFGCRRTA